MLFITKLNIVKATFFKEISLHKWVKQFVYCCCDFRWLDTGCADRKLFVQLAPMLELPVLSDEEDEGEEEKPQSGIDSAS